jgi:hypothetical protein
MSAASSSPHLKSSDQNLAFVVRMGADPAEGYDPIPPSQYLCFLDPNFTISPRGHRALAWMRRQTLRLKKGGRTPWAAQDGKPLRLRDMAEDLSWSLPAATRIWTELETAGLVMKDEQLRLCLCGTVHPGNMGNPDEPEPELTPEERKRISKIPGYIARQIQGLEERDRRRATRTVIWAQRYVERLEADAMQGARQHAQEFLERMLAPFGITLRRHKDKEQVEAPAPFVKVQVIAEPQPIEEEPAEDPEEEPESVEKNSVHNFSGNPVQGQNAKVYSVENAPVQGLQPYRTENREDYRVSKYEDPGTRPASEADLPTTQDPEATPRQTPAEPERVESIAAAKTLPVEKGERTPETNPVLRTVEKLFGKASLTDALRSDFRNLAAEFEITAEAVSRFLVEKMEEKIAANWFVKGPHVLLSIARADLPGWITQNRPLLARLADEAARNAPPPVLTAAEQREAEQRELDQLEWFTRDFPNHMNHARDVARLEELRRKFGKASEGAAG